MTDADIRVFWLEQQADEVPPDDTWLSAAERERLAGMRIAKRRSDWRLGRWTAKRAVAAFLKLDPTPATLAAIEVRPDASGAPEAFCDGAAAPVAISLSHSNGIALCAIADPGSALGCDLEVIASHSDAFVADFFTEGERLTIARTPVADHLWLVPLLWSAKESALKALRTGLRADTRSVEVSWLDASPPDRWTSFEARCADGRVFSGWAQRSDTMVRTVVSTRLARIMPTEQRDVEARPVRI